MRDEEERKPVIKNAVAGITLLMFAGYGFTANLRKVSHTLYREVDASGADFLPLISIYAICGLAAYGGMACLRLAWKRRKPLWRLGRAQTSLARENSP
ncbi:MAG: hypothetical protein ACRERD_09190 [Candidatus Binatia bacterium]